VPCSRTLRRATNGESRDRTDNLGVAGRPPDPTELQPPPEEEEEEEGGGGGRRRMRRKEEEEEEEDVH